MENILDYTPAFKKFGFQMIRFATEEPQLFRVIYMEMNEEGKSFEEMIRNLGEPVQVCIDVIQKDYGVSRQDAQRIFRQAWIYTFSVCVLQVNKICSFSPDEITEMLGMEFQGSLMLVKTGKYVKKEVTENR